MQHQEVALEVVAVPTPIELARRIQTLGNRVAVVEEHQEHGRRQHQSLNGIVADQGELVITTRTVVSGCVGEVDRLKYGLGTTDTRLERVEDLSASLDRRVRDLQGAREGALTVNAVVGFGVMGLVLVAGLWNLNARTTANQEQSAARMTAVEGAIGVQQQELARARAQQRVDAQYLVNELVKKRNR